MYRGSQCKGFANWIFLKIFGVYIGSYPESANYKITNPNAQTIGILEPGVYTQERQRRYCKKEFLVIIFRFREVPPEGGDLIL